MSGRVGYWEKYRQQGSRSCSGRVGVLKYTISYFQASFWLTGIFRYSWVLLGISGYIGYIICFLEEESQIISFFLTCIVGYPIPSNFWEYLKLQVSQNVGQYPMYSVYWIGPGCVSQKIPGSGSSLGTRWALSLYFGHTSGWNPAALIMLI